MVTAELSTLLLDWSTAVIELKLEKVHALLEKEPELLWTPIPHSLDEPNHLNHELHELLKLGTSFLPVSAIQYCLIHYKDLPDMSEQVKRYRLLAYLIEQSSVHDLDTRFWGECNNSTLHLVCFLGHLNVLKLLVTKGVSITPTNELGYTPRDVASDEYLTDYLRSLPKKNQVSRQKSVRPNYSTPDRFRLLRELAEESSVVGGDDEKKIMIGLDRQKSDGRFFRKGHVKETQKKVLTEDEEELEKQRAKRQHEMTQLVKKSAVKNNPLYKKLEKRTFTAPVLANSSLVSDSPFNNDNLVEEPQDINPALDRVKRKASKRNSQVINSLQKKSYVSTSIFLQDTAEKKPTPVPSVPSSPLEEICATSKVLDGDIHMTTKHDIPKHLEESEQDVVESLDIRYNPIPLQKGTETAADMVIHEEEQYMSEHVHDSESSDDNEEEEEDIRDAYFVDQEHISAVAEAVAEAVEEEQVGESSDDADFLSLESENESDTSEDEDIKYTTAEIKRLSQNMLAAATQPVIQEKEDQVEEEEEEEEEDVDSGTEEILHTAAEIKRFSQNFIPKLDVESDTDDEETYEKLYNYEMYPDDDDPISPEEPDIPAMHDDSSSEEELEEGTASAVHIATRMVTPVYKSVMVKSEEDLKEENAPNKAQPEVLTTLPPRRLDSSLSIDTLKSGTSVSSTPAVSTIQKHNAVMAPKIPEQQQQQASRHESQSFQEQYYRQQQQQIQLQQQQQQQLQLQQQQQQQQQQQLQSRQEQPSRPDRSDLRKSQQPRKGSRDSKRMSGSQKASWTMSMSSWAAILDREFNLEELDPNNKRLTIKESLEKKSVEQTRKEQEKEEEEGDELEAEEKYMPLMEEKIEITNEDMNLMLNQGLARTSFDKSTLSLAHTLDIKGVSRSSTRVNQMHPPQNTLSNNTSRNSTKQVPAPQLEEIPRLQSSKSIRRKPIDSMATSSLNLPKRTTSSSDKKFNTMPSISHTARHDHGKLYLHVNGVQDILLPLPKERAYVRCVVSDGRFEYMSRYEILSENINFNYECVIDTHRDMIITISLHVRPDYVMKSRTPFSRFFSSKKKKETLSGYVNKEDGAIGQARFALAHMVPVCQETSYMAGFHCFNAWYSRSFKERHRQKKKDPNYEVLKVVGNFDVEMLYLPVTNYQQVFPRNLRECEKAIRLNSRTE